jgi:rRNA maturation endonuclease Nob1
LGCSPFKALYGHEPNVGALPNNKEATRSSVAEVIQELQDQAIVLKEHLAKAQNKMKHAADKKRRHQEYQVGNMFF